MIVVAPFDRSRIAISQRCAAKFRKAALTSSIEESIEPAWSHVGTMPARTSRCFPRWWTESDRRQASRRRRRRRRRHVGVGRPSVRVWHGCEALLRRPRRRPPPRNVNISARDTLAYNPYDSSDSQRHINTTIRRWITVVERCTKDYRYYDRSSCDWYWYIRKQEERKSVSLIGRSLYHSLRYRYRRYVVP